MRTLRMLVLLGSLSSMASAQGGSLSDIYFPSAVGNVWNYQHQGPTRITRDSAVKGTHFIFFDSSTVPLYAIDTLSNVVRDPTSEGYRSVVYKLSAKLGDTWIAHRMETVNFVGRLDDSTRAFLFGQLVPVLRIGYYYQPPEDTTYFSSWAYDDYLAGGIGVFLSIGDATQIPNLALLGCIIDGVTYGDMTAVSREGTSSEPFEAGLYPAFPNPFNPTTTIRYRIANRADVWLGVYNGLGQLVAVLIDEPQNEGLHIAKFEASGLASGVYICRLRTGRSSLSSKMVLLK